MSVFDTLRAMLRPRLTYQVSMGPYVSVADMGIAELYRTQPNLRAVVSYLTDNAAQVPIKVYERVSDTDRQRSYGGLRRSYREWHVEYQRTCQYLRGRCNCCRYRSCP